MADTLSISRVNQAIYFVPHEHDKCLSVLEVFSIRAIPDAQLPRNRAISAFCGARAPVASMTKDRLSFSKGQGQGQESQLCVCAGAFWWPSKSNTSLCESWLRTSGKGGRPQYSGNLHATQVKYFYPCSHLLSKEPTFELPFRQSVL